MNMTCHNEGYVTRVKGKCQCMCVGRLDPETGCTTMLPSGKSHTSSDRLLSALAMVSSGKSHTSFDRLLWPLAMLATNKSHTLFDHCV